MGAAVTGMCQIGVGGAVVGGDVDCGSLYGGHGWGCLSAGVSVSGSVRTTERIMGIVTRPIRGTFRTPGPLTSP